MAFIAYVPVAWIFVNAALFMAAAGAIGLPREMQLLAMLCFALSPLTQLLHAIGMVDHHYVEHTFVLSSLWLGFRWFERPDEHTARRRVGRCARRRRAFHNGLFILQLLPLAAVFVLWLRGAAPPPAALCGFAIALFVTTQLVLLPSEPYRRDVRVRPTFVVSFLRRRVHGAALGFMAWRPFTRRNSGFLAPLCAARDTARAQLMAGAGSCPASSRSSTRSSRCAAPTSCSRNYRARRDGSYYSWLLLLHRCCSRSMRYRIMRESEPDAALLRHRGHVRPRVAARSISPALLRLLRLVTGGLLLVDDLARAPGLASRLDFVAAFAAVVLAYQPALRERLFVFYAPGSDPEYASVFALLT